MTLSKFLDPKNDYAFKRIFGSENELDTYEAEEKRERDERSVLIARLQDAKKEGLAEGLSKGMLEEQKKIAKNLLRESTDLELIARVTRLSIGEITRLQAED